MSKVRPTRKYKVKHVRSTDVYAANKLLMQTYGVRNVTILSKFYGLVSKSRNVYKTYAVVHPCYIKHVEKLKQKGILTDPSESLLTLSVTNFLERSLQFLVATHKKVTISAARQLITSKKIKTENKTYVRPTAIISFQEELLLFGTNTQNNI